MKKNNKKGVSPKASCGKEGCSLKEYTMPYAGTAQDFNRHLKEKFKNFNLKLAA